MKTLRRRTRGLTTAALFGFGLALPLSAQSGEPENHDETNPRYMLASQIIGTDLMVSTVAGDAKPDEGRERRDEERSRSEKRQSVGEIGALVLDRRDAKIHFAIVETGGFLGVGERLTAIPYSLVSWNHVKGDARWVPVVSSLSKKALESAPAFEKGKLSEHLSDDAWMAQTRSAFGTYPDGTVFSGKGDHRVLVATSGDESVLIGGPATWCLTSDLVGADVLLASPAKPVDEGRRAREGDEKTQARRVKTFGEIDDLVLSTQGRCVTAVLVEAGGLVGIGETTYIIPWKALSATEKEGQVRLALTAEQMKLAPKLSKDPVKRLENEEMRRQLCEFYGVELGN